jgi:hypothetical protein
MKTSRIVSASVVALISCFGLATQLYAVSDRGAAAREAAESRAEEKKQQVAAKLDENKKKVCEKRHANITKVMHRMQARSEKQLEVFTKIADRTKAFYQEKQRTVANYDDLVAAVDEKKQAAELTLTAGSEAIAGFTCDSSDPIAAKDLFKAQLKDQITALKAYKTAVKDLIVGVKSAQGEASRSTNDTETTQTDTTQTTEHGPEAETQTHSETEAETESGSNRGTR